MKKILPLLGLFLTMLACSIPQTVTPPPIAPPPAEGPSVPSPNLTCNELSLYVDPALAASYDCRTIPEADMEFEVYPQYTEITLHGYPLADKFFKPRISVYPVQRYRELLPDIVPARVADLQAMVAGGIPRFSDSFGSSLPFLPTFNAGQVFHAQGQALPFRSGSGIRFLTQYAQYFAPVNNHDLFYTYQGLTADGLYWVSVILPVSHPMLPPNADNPPEGMSWDDFTNNYGPYLVDMVNRLNAQPPGSFTPSLTALDALAASITIVP